MSWTVYCHGPVKIWVNVVVTFDSPESVLPNRRNWYQSPRLGWSQMVVKVGASSKKTWVFSITPFENNEMIATAYELGSLLPNDVKPLESGDMIIEMFLLQTDFDINQPINTTSKVTLNIYDEKPVQFSWNPQVSRDGIFGSVTDIIAGKYNQYYSFAVYSTGVVGAITVSFNYAFGLFIDDNFVYNTNSGTFTIIEFNLTLGWHHLVFKLTVSDDFQWIHDDATITCSQAMTSCQSIGYSQLCNFDAYCPYKLKRKSLPNFTDSTFAPILSASSFGMDDYVRFHTGGGKLTSFCERWSETHGNVVPPWSESNESVDVRRGYGCCGNFEAPKISVRFYYREGELGFRVAAPNNPIEPLTGTVDDPESAEQTVTLSHPDKDAVIFYDFSLALDNVTSYTVPFLVTKTTFVIFWAVKGIYRSDYQYLTVEIPSAAVLHRSTYHVNLPCAIGVTGTAKGRHMAIVWENNAEIESYNQYSTASEITKGPRTSGSVTVDLLFYTFILVEGLLEGIYASFYYPFNDVGHQLGSAIRIESFTLSPLQLIGHQDTTFRGEGLGPWDGMLFLEQWSNGATRC
ncbi:hypothetical protein LSM04_004554 [Trypanosoma melophagium]|uniref:uncharacterized protein n=1 Tax=Trypanosoma melophagium TaxID=715481 RepID=UPI00351A9742|nr:hypothetical protein LSM04_004554 [Trypanosoma melophagium]